MRRARFIVAIGIATLYANHTAAQHDGHQAPAAGAPAAEVALCGQAQPVVNGLVEAALKRLEAARLTNTPAAMRDAVDDLQAVLIDIRQQLAPCAQIASSVAAGHAGHAPGI